MILFLTFLVSTWAQPAEPERGVIMGTPPDPSDPQPDLDPELFGHPANPDDPLEFSDLQFGQMSNERHPFIILFKKEGEGEEGAKSIKVLREFEENNKDNVGVKLAWAQFPEVDPEQPHIPEGQEKLQAIIGIEYEELPLLVAITPEGDRLDLTSEVDSLKLDQLALYVKDIQEGNYRKYMKSEQPVDNEGQDLITLVGTNYNEAVKDEQKDVFVMIYSNKCGHCRKMVPSWKKLAKEYTNNPDVIIAKLDGEKNQVEGLSTGRYPTLIFYGKDNSRPIYYNSDDREFEKLRDWFENHKQKSEQNDSGKEDL